MRDWISILCFDFLPYAVLIVSLSFFAWEIYDHQTAPLTEHIRESKERHKALHAAGLEHNDVEVLWPKPQ